MSLSCYCYYDPEPGAVLWASPRDYAPLATKKSRKCCSCTQRINKGDLCAEVRRSKVPETEIEDRIYGEETGVPRASAYLCERCADLAFSLEELGFCPQPWEDQRELVKEYAEMQRQLSRPLYPSGEQR